MTDLETLEKQLQSLLEELIPTPKGEATCDIYCAPDYDAQRQARLELLLLERRILEVHNAIEERKDVLKDAITGNFMMFHNTSKSISFRGDPDLYRKAYNAELLVIWHIGKPRYKITDYEWEWLKQQEGVNE